MRTILDDEQTCIHQIQLDNYNRRQQQRYKRVAPKKLRQAAAHEEPVQQVASWIVVEPVVQEEHRLEQLELDRAQEEQQPASCKFETAAQTTPTPTPTTTTTTTTTAAGLQGQEMDNIQQATKRIQQQHLAQQQQQHQPLGRLQVAAAAAALPGANSQVTRYLMGAHENHQHSSSYPPKSYPNNTLVEDLSRCHGNLWPKAARATSRTLKLIRACAPASVDSASKAKQKELSKSVNLNCASDETPVPGGQLETPMENKKLKFVRAKRKKYKFPIPDSILRLNSTLNQEDYNRALCVLTNDIRFQLHILFFGRLQTIWTLFSTILCILIPILFAATTLETFVILGACAVWLGLQATGVLVTSRCRKKLDQMLERSVAQANSYFLDHKLMLGVINVGGLLTKSRLVIPMVYFDTFECIEQIESIISADLSESINATDGKSDKDLPKRQQLVRPVHPTEFGPSLDEKESVASQKSFAQSQLAKKIVLRYSQRWISHFDKRRLMFTDDKLKPRHLSTGKCLCQFIEEHLRRDGQIEDLEQLQEANKVDQSDPATAAAVEQTIEQLRVDKLESKPGGYDITHQQQQQQQQQLLTIINIPTTNKNDFSELDEQLLIETLVRSRTLACQTGARSTCSNYGPHAELFVPSLSQLVSMKEGQQQQTRANTTTECSSNSSPSSNYSSKLIDGFASHLQQERIESNSSPTTELSLELEGESYLNRNDELIRRLKTLLEIRANEFSRGLDQASNSISQQYHQESVNSPRSMCKRDRSLLHDGGGGLSSGSSLSNQTIHQDDASNTNNNHGSPISQIGKKFFSQTDGIFFLGTKKGHQQGVYAKQQQQLLKIC